MKEWFFTAIMVAIPVGLGAGLLWLLGHGIYTLYNDWRLGKEIDQLQAESAIRREKRRQENEQRWNNGCQHEVGGVFDIFPPGVCHKCGVAREKPSGNCDHIWRMAKEATPYTFCEKCNKRYLGTASTARAL